MKIKAGLRTTDMRLSHEVVVSTLCSMLEGCVWIGVLQVSQDLMENSREQADAGPSQGANLGPPFKCKCGLGHTEGTLLLVCITLNMFWRW